MEREYGKRERDGEREGVTGRQRERDGERRGYGGYLLIPSI